MRKLNKKEEMMEGGQGWFNMVGGERERGARYEGQKPRN